MLPERAQVFVRFNPFFYFVDGLRYAMIGIQESNMIVGALLILGLILFLGGLTLMLFRRGWRIKT
jgi:ABC-2 type transport system permease protein